MNWPEWKSQMSGRIDPTSFGSHWKIYQTCGILLVVIGILALMAAELTTFVSVRFIGWALLFGGITQFLSIAGEPAAADGSFALGLVNGVLYFVAGGFLLARPISGLVAITMLVAFYLMASGFMTIIAAFTMRLPRWGWMVASGIFSVALGWLTISRWASAAPWILGAIVGVGMVVYGASLVTIAQQGKKIAQRPRPIQEAA